MRIRTRPASALTAALAVLGATALSASLALPAQAATADYAPGAHDVVGVGSDTLQFILDFGDDGDAVGDAGYNSAGNSYKVVSIDATADSNARGAYLNNSTYTDLQPLDPTVVLRAGSYPVERPNGSGAGISALLADTSSADPYIDFVRMASAPTAAEGGTAVTNGWGGLQVVTLGSDDLAIAADQTSTNAPAGLSAQQLVQIYECNDTKWTQVGGTSSDTIIPAIPVTGSGTRTTFLNDLAAANGGTAITLGSCVITVEQNDPTAITGNADPADVIEPFSGSRLNLWNGVSGDTAIQPSSGVGYFHTPTVAYPGGAALTPGVALLTGKPSDGNSVYDDDRNLYVVYRYSDQTSTTAWQPGGKLNWAQTLFCDPSGPAPFFDTGPGQALIAQAGATPDYSCASSPLT